LCVICDLRLGRAGDDALSRAGHAELREQLLGL
jgi:hypothetical protein